MRFSITFSEHGRRLILPIPMYALLRMGLGCSRIGNYGLEEAKRRELLAMSKLARRELRRYVRAHGHFELLRVETANGETIQIRV